MEFSTLDVNVNVQDEPNPNDLCDVHVGLATYGRSNNTMN